MQSGTVALVGSIDWRAPKTSDSVIGISLSIVEGVEREEMGEKYHHVFIYMRDV